MMHKRVLLTLKDAKYWVDITLPESEVKSSDDDYADYEDSEFQWHAVWETGVQPLTDTQRLIFSIVTILITAIAIVGNILVLYVNISRFSLKRGDQIRLN
jgi:hypothetical protein